MLQYSLTVRNNHLDNFETTVGTSPILKLATGAPPANCAAVASGTIVATMTLPADWMNAASGGTKTKLGTWEDPAADNSGHVSHWRLYDSAGTTCHAQGLACGPWVPTHVYALNDYVTNDSGKVYKVTTAGTSAASGGPTGTGTGITDGTVVWAYVQAAAEMTLDNADVLAAQDVLINTFTLTAGNA